MKTLTVKHFGTIDLDNITEEQEYLEIDFQGRRLLLMWFAEESIEKEYANNASTALENLQEFDDKNKAFLQSIFSEEDNIVHEFLEFHLDELEEELSDFIDKNKTKMENLNNLFNHLKLTTISFHNDVIVADYSLNSDLSDQILAVSLNNDRSRELSWDS